MSRERCPFCGSDAHSLHRCNSNFGGQRTKLDAMEEFLADEECPKFQEFPVNHLRYIAHHYAIYEKAINTSTWCRGRSYNQKFVRNPIPLTLPKARLVKALVHRWTEFKPIRDLKRAVPENDDCPICLETQLTGYAWSTTHSRWNMCSENEQAIITACNHRFCQPCWGLHLASNVRRDHVGVYISCPMCRRRLNHVR
ncbi:MAG: hypothetical protein MUP82_05800 [Candidatus Marinimicrobia bacterium]|nr:hypothetical protein [Candidatus Neomarinimicrobiota bacterium]